MRSQRYISQLQVDYCVAQACLYVVCTFAFVRMFRDRADTGAARDLSAHCKETGSFRYTSTYTIRDLRLAGLSLRVYGLRTCALDLCCAVQFVRADGNELARIHASEEDTAIISAEFAGRGER